METVRVLHQYWAYLVLLVLVLATFNAVIKSIGKKEYEPRDFRVSLFTLIVSHIQLLIGMVLWFSADYFSELSMGEIMKNSVLRSNVVEHPVAMILAVVCITIGYSKHKKQLSSAGKLKKIAIFYSTALLLVCAKIPWDRLF